MSRSRWWGAVLCAFGRHDTLNVFGGKRGRGVICIRCAGHVPGKREKTLEELKHEVDVGFFNVMVLCGALLFVMFVVIPVVLAIRKAAGQ